MQGLGKGSLFRGHLFGGFTVEGKTLHTHVPTYIEASIDYCFYCYAAHDVEAKANVKIVCQDYEFVILAVDSEGVFIVETRNQSSDWDKGLVWVSVRIY